MSIAKLTSWCYYINQRRTVFPKQGIVVAICNVSVQSPIREMKTAVLARTKVIAVPGGFLTADKNWKTRVNHKVQKLLLKQLQPEKTEII